MTKSSETVTRTQLLERYFNGIEEADAHLDHTLKAMGLKPGGKNFKPITAYCIGVARSWIDRGEFDNYDALEQAWGERKGSVEAAFEQEGGALTQAQHGDMVAGSDVDSHTGSHTGSHAAQNLAIPAQRSYDAGLQIAQGMEGRIQHNQELAAKVVDGAFYRGLTDGLGKLGNDYQPEPLVTEQQVDDILDLVVENARRSHEQNN